MNELDEIWSKMLSQAMENAKASGRDDLAAYLNLKATNDAVRQVGVRWLFETMIEAAGDANRTNMTISIERNDPHRFLFRGANLVGSLIRFRQGVRCLTVEAGWTRTPADGFMRGGALAFARINHLGMPKASSELALTTSTEAPVWKLVREEKLGEILTSLVLRGHVRTLIGA